jgi:anti-sigma B factor antagonist
MIRNVRRQGDVTIVEIEGHFDAQGAPEMKAKLHDLIDEGNNKLVFELQEMEFIDSAGLGVLVSCLRRAAAKGGDVRLAEVPPFCRSIFELTRLTRVFDVNESLEHAVEVLSEAEGD